MLRIPLIVLFVSCAAAFDLENGVAGKPDVECGIENIVVSLSTRKTFRGRLYVQGESEQENCIRTSKDGSDHPQFQIDIGECNMRRQRTLHPRGVAFSFTLVVSFHPFFVTGLDRAFNVRCFFLESVKSLNAEVDVGVLTTEVLEQDFPLPVCTYELREGVHGAPIHFAEVGQKVSHVWTCDQAVSWVYGILIHSCFADDGQGNKFQLVDDRGCSTDGSLLPQIQYETDSITASTQAHVFKYADKIQLYFTCTVQLCYKHDGGCDGVTPPACQHNEGGLPDESSFHLPEGPRLMPNAMPFIHLNENQPGSIEHFLPPKPDFVPRIPEFESAKKFMHHENPKKIGHSGEHHFEESPNHSAGRGEKSPFQRAPYKDSPLNETEKETEFLTSTLDLRKTNVIYNDATPASLVSVGPGVSVATPAPLRTTTSTSGDHREPQTVPSDQVSEKTSSPVTKQRRDLKNMETDLSVDVIVLPQGTEENKREQHARYRSSSSPNVCLSRTNLGILVSATILTILFIAIISYIFARRHSGYDRKTTHMDAFH